jgi:hypothetical protein
MNYICLVYHEERALFDLSMEEHQAITTQCISWIQNLAKNGHHVYSAGLQSTKSATTLSYSGDELSVTDGPFAETKEVLGGFTIIEARDLNEAIRIASEFPAARFGKVEVRPVMDPANEMDDPIDRKVAEAVRNSIAALA